MPALILIYTLMDTFAWACSDKTQGGVRAKFEAWVERWVISQGLLNCTATELYAARCGVLHTLTGYADLTKNPLVRKITYAWGTATTTALAESLSVLGRTDIVAVHVSDLFEGVRLAMANVTNEAENDPALMERLEEAAALHFSGLEIRTVAQFLEQVHGETNV